MTVGEGFTHDHEFGSCVGAKRPQVARAQRVSLAQRLRWQHQSAHECLLLQGVTARCCFNAGMVMAFVILFRFCMRNLWER